LAWGKEKLGGNSSKREKKRKREGGRESFFPNSTTAPNSGKKEKEKRSDEVLREGGGGKKGEKGKAYSQTLYLPAQRGGGKRGEKGGGEKSSLTLSSAAFRRGGKKSPCPERKEKKECHLIYILFRHGRKRKVEKRIGSEKGEEGKNMLQPKKR